MTIIYSIDGNIGSGKSTFVSALKEYFSRPENCQWYDEESGNSHAIRIHFLQEPVNIWETIKDRDGKTVLECFYADQASYSFSFQMMAYISRLASLRRAVREGYDIIFTERCVYTDRNVFAKMLYDDGKIREIDYQIYNMWFDEFISDFKQFNYIYINTDYNIADSRVKKRARKGEEIPVEYLKKCHEYHEQWLNSIMPSSLYNITFDGNISTTDKPDLHDEWCEMVKHKLLPISYVSHLSNSIKIPPSAYLVE